GARGDADSHCRGLSSIHRRTRLFDRTIASLALLIYRRAPRDRRRAKGSALLPFAMRVQRIRDSFGPQYRRCACRLDGVHRRVPAHQRAHAVVPASHAGARCDPRVTRVGTQALATLAAAATGALQRAANDYAPAAFASSFGAEDMVLVDLIAKSALPITIFTLDTGRLHDETLALIDRVRS